jgi:high-affinity Fe2+/Pb2+ permease
MKLFSTAAYALALLAALVLAGGGVKLSLRRQTRTKGALMIAAAAVIVMNVMIATV